MSEQYKYFIEAQESVYDKFRAITEQMARGQGNGIERDPGTDPQGAFLVAWRHPEKTTSLIEEFSLEAADLISAVTYDQKNAHTTVSDYGLKPNVVINPAYEEAAETLTTLTQAVRNALNISGKDVISGLGVEFKDTPTNGKTIIAAGIPTESIVQINQQIKDESAALGIPLKGTWGSHTTINRFLEDKVS